MSEFYGPYIEELRHAVLPTEDLSDMTYKQSLDQHTRVKDREDALDELVVKHPTTKIEINDSLNKTGKMLMKRGNPEDDMYYDSNNPFSSILNVLANEGGSAYIPDIVNGANVSVQDILRSEITNVLDVDRLALKVSSPPLKEHIKGLKNQGETPPFVRPITMRENQIYFLGVGD